MVINIKNLINLTTPQYLLIGILSPFSFYLLINMKFPGFEILPIIISFSFSILGFNIFNQISDMHIDKIDKPLRPLVSEQVTIREAMLLAIFFFVASILLSMLVNLYFLSLIILFFIVIFCYCEKYIYLKKYFWSSSVVGLIIYGLIPPLSIMTISNNSINPIFLIFFAILFAIISNTKDFEDLQGEKEFGINSLPLMIGFEKATFVIISLNGIFILGVLMVSTFNYIPSKYIYASLISFIIFIINSYIFWKEIKLIKYKHITFSEIRDPQIKNVITQSEAPTTSILFVLIVQLIFGFTALYSF